MVMTLVFRLPMRSKSPRDELEAALEKGAGRPVQFGILTSL